MIADTTAPGAPPPRLPVTDVLVSRTDYEAATAAVMRAAVRREPLVAAATSVHGLAVAARDPLFRAQLNDFDIVTPDGQPVRWALNLLHGAGLADRVYGPELMLRLCRAAARSGVAVYLYGARPATLERLAARLPELAPGLRIAGYRSPPFRPLTREEDDADVERIRDSGAGLVFVGLGCPRQERWAHERRFRLGVPIVCVGAAFDFHAGVLRQAPPALQACGLEWLFRLLLEPRRLWRRYATSIPIFLARFGRQYAERFLDRPTTLR